MKGLQFVTLVMVFSLMVLPFYINSGSSASLHPDDQQIETMTANNDASGLAIFILSSSRDSSQEDERESLEQGQIISMCPMPEHLFVISIHPQNTSLPPAITISRDTPPPRSIA